MVACKMSIKKIFDRIKRVDKCEEFKTTYGITLSDEKEKPNLQLIFISRLL